MDDDERSLSSIEGASNGLPVNAVTESGLKTFWQVGEALVKVRDGRLYRETHGTFEEYCRERWTLARSTAYQLIDAVTVRVNLSAVADILPETESQTRPLTTLKDPEDQVRAWQAAIADAPEGHNRFVTASLCSLERVVRPGGEAVTSA